MKRFRGRIGLKQSFKEQDLHLYDLLERKFYGVVESERISLCSTKRLKQHVPAFDSGDSVIVIP